MKMIQVTTWAESGITPDFRPGRWVQIGRPTYLNFLLTGLPGGKFYFTKPYFKSSNVPFSNHATAFVDKSELQFPKGFGLDGFIKGLLGQRKLR